MGKNRRRKANIFAERNKIVVIRQRRNYRIFMSLFSLLLMAVTVFLSVCIWISAQEEAGLMAMLLVLIEGMLCLPMVLWYTTWKVTLHEQGIRKELFGHTIRDYTWNQVQAVENFYPYGSYDYIYVLFKDGKKLNFRMDCDNASEAKRMLLSHFSITLTGRHRLDK